MKTSCLGTIRKERLSTTSHLQGDAANMPNNMTIRKKTPMKYKFTVVMAIFLEGGGGGGLFTIILFVSCLDECPESKIIV